MKKCLLDDFSKTKIRVFIFFLLYDTYTNKINKILSFQLVCNVYFKNLIVNIKKFLHLKKKYFVIFLCFDLCFIYLECNDGGQTRIIIFKEINNFYIEKLFMK